MSNAPAAPQMVRRDDRAARGPGRVVKRNRRGARGTRARCGRPQNATTRAEHDAHATLGATPQAGDRGAAATVQRGDRTSNAETGRRIYDDEMDCSRKTKYPNRSAPSPLMPVERLFIYMRQRALGRRDRCAKRGGRPVRRRRYRAPLPAPAVADKRHAPSAPSVTHYGAVTPSYEAASTCAIAVKHGGYCLDIRDL
ncbi:hypothetical protein EVAR_40359_1 [Eumeta japonica]|uniref:Uncharacterized protein n=1 Tax=Eumeta variegata TaxID=151549 RepID=A0A4C1XNH5_EUMVA|nr:hypothetical protein EVAR_40359_1 [Eumeta japonica]